MSRGYISVTVVGTVGKDPETRSTQSGKKVANFSVAVDQGFGDNIRTEWVNLVAFGSQAEVVEKIIKKGKVVAVSGGLQTSSWDDKQTGIKRYKTEVIVRDVQLMDSGPKQEGRPAATPQTRQTTQPTPRATTDSDPFEDGTEIPF